MLQIYVLHATLWLENFSTTCKEQGKHVQLTQTAPGPCAKRMRRTSKGIADDTAVLLLYQPAFWDEVANVPVIPNTESVPGLGTRRTSLAFFDMNSRRHVARTLARLIKPSKSQHTGKDARKMTI